MSGQKVHYNVFVRDLIVAGIIMAGQSIEFEPRYGEIYRGHIEANGDIVLGNSRFQSLSSAAAKLAGSNRNGWEGIKANGKSLTKYRDEFLRTHANVDRANRQMATTVTTLPDKQPEPSQTSSPPQPVETARHLNLHQLIQEHLIDLARQVAQRISDLASDQFEELVAKILEQLSYENVRRVGGTGDRNVDVIGNYRPPFAQISVRVQVKHRQTSANIGPGDVGAFRDRAGGVGHTLLMMTNVEFTNGAKELASEQGRQLVHLIDGKELVDSMIEQKIGIKEGPLGVLEIDDEFWGEF